MRLRGALLPNAIIARLPSPLAATGANQVALMVIMTAATSERRCEVR